MTHISYDQYQKHLNENIEEFNNLQIRILEESNDYNTNRYNIVKTSLEKLITQNKDFKNLLGIICLVDSQNISKDLLIKYNNNQQLIDDFLYGLQRFSLITVERSTSKISFHRSIQQAILCYLTKENILTKDSNLVQKIIKILQNYTENIFLKEDFSEMKNLLVHYEKLLDQDSLLSEIQKDSLKGYLGRIYFYLRNDKKSKPLLNDSLKNLVTLEKKDYLLIARILNDLGVLYTDLGELDKAKQKLEQGISIYHKYPPSIEGHRVGSWSLIQLAYVEMEKGNYKEAEKYFKESLRISSTYFEKDQKEYAGGLSNLGIFYYKLGNYEEAEKLLNQSYSIFSTYYPPNHIGIVWIQVYLGIICTEKGEYEKAKFYLEKSLSIYREAFSENHVYCGWVLSHLGILYNEMKDFDRAEKVLMKSKEIHCEIFSTHNIRTAWTQVLLADNQRNLKRYYDARKIIKQYEQLYNQRYNSKHPKWGWFLLHLGNSYKGIKDYASAQNCLEKALNIYINHYGPYHLFTAKALKALAEVYYYQEDKVKSKTSLYMAWSIFFNS